MNFIMKQSLQIKTLQTKVNQTQSLHVSVNFYTVRIDIQNRNIKFYTFSIEYISCTYSSPTPKLHDRIRKAINFISSLINHVYHLKRNQIFFSSTIF